MLLFIVNLFNHSSIYWNFILSLTWLTFLWDSSRALDKSWTRFSCTSTLGGLRRNMTSFICVWRATRISSPYNNGEITTKTWKYKMVQRLRNSSTEHWCINKRGDQNLLGIKLKCMKNTYNSHLKENSNIAPIQPRHNEWNHESLIIYKTVMW
jgi:hypothetical protein